MHTCVTCFKLQNEHRLGTLKDRCDIVALSSVTAAVRTSTIPYVVHVLTCVVAFYRYVKLTRS